jgi:hypothetical protein
MSDSDDDTRALQLARLEVKVDSILEQLREDRETMKERFVENRLGDLDKHAAKTDRWIHALPVGTVIGFVIAVGGLVSYVNGITP